MHRGQFGETNIPINGHTAGVCDADATVRFIQSFIVRSRLHTMSLAATSTDISIYDVHKWEKRYPMKTLWAGLELNPWESVCIRCLASFECCRIVFYIGHYITIEMTLPFKTLVCRPRNIFTAMLGI